MVGEKEKSVLKPEEIDFVAGLAITQDNPFLERQRGLKEEERFQKVWGAWQDRNWEIVLSVINKIPEDRDLNSLTMANFPGKPYVRSIAQVSIGMLLKNTTKHLTAGQVKLVGRVLMRMYPDGLGLGSEPWKTMFFENAKKSLPNSVGTMIEEVGKAGIDKQEYVKVLRYTIVGLTQNATQEDLTNAIYSSENFLSYISDFYGVSNLDPGEKARLLKAGDILLGRWYREYGPQYLERACQIYEWLDKKGIAIYRRSEIVEIRERYIRKVPVWGEIGGAISVRLTEMRIRRIIRGIAKEFNIIIE